MRDILARVRYLRKPLLELREAEVRHSPTPIVPGAAGEVRALQWPLCFLCTGECGVHKKALEHRAGPLRIEGSISRSAGPRRGMRGGRLNDVMSVASRGAAAHPPNELSLSV